ncbi:B12-binding domain-containing radical SAM protein [Pelosinus fermentans]|uniref:Radical SAM domain protein n=1 Tax=Pelosinus fermentans JBW45 TaxID=1192197 RepID=I8TV32_9FIRM|nr:B12-binding domain-containing radical SAM protein [Pelosinus fermentans]AJQ26601.1 Radical SAM domain protein [Pelosinus fermentans JBW45]
METIDCYFVGINTVSIAKQRNFAKIIHGENSHEYRDDSNFRFVKCNNKLYTQSQIFELFYNDEKVSNSYELSVFEETFNSAIAYLGTYLTKRGLSIEYINSFNSEKEELASKLVGANIHAVAIPTTHYTTAFPITEIVSFIKKYDAKVKIIVGGPFITNQVRSLNGDALQRLFYSIGADIYVYNSEGEYALNETVKAIKDSLPLDSISNIYYKKNNKFVINDYYPEENDLDNNSTDWNLFANRLGKYVSVRSAMSCPFSCGFCTYGGRGFKEKYRYSSIETLEKELDDLKNSGKVSGIFFSDNTFNVPLKRFKDILRLMIRKRYNFKWQTHIRCQFIDEETAALLQESGCVQVFCGLESGSQKILNNMNKRATLEECKKGIELLNKYNIMSVASFFIGYPGESDETAMETFKFIEETKPTFFQIRLWWYAQNAPIFNQKEKYNLTGSGFNWCHETMNADYAHELVDKFYLTIKNSTHLGDTQNIFDMKNRGISVNNIKGFVDAFNNCVKERLGNPSVEETSCELLDKLRIAAKRCVVSHES